MAHNAAFASVGSRPESVVPTRKFERPLTPKFVIAMCPTTWATHANITAVRLPNLGP